MMSTSEQEPQSGEHGDDTGAAGAVGVAESARTTGAGSTRSNDEQHAAHAADGAGEAPVADRRSPRFSPSDDLVREGEIAADFLESLLDISDLDGDLEVDVEGDRAAVAIVDSEDGPAPRALVGSGGSVLDALQELTRLAVQAETGERSRLMLDVAGFRADRRSELVRTAKQAIDQVKESGERRALEPMTAFERKVVHDEVLAAGLHSESEGAEPARFVVILPGD